MVPGWCFPCADCFFSWIAVAATMRDRVSDKHGASQISRSLQCCRLNDVVVGSEDYCTLPRLQISSLIGGTRDCFGLCSGSNSGDTKYTVSIGLSGSSHEGDASVSVK